MPASHQPLGRGSSPPLLPPPDAVLAQLSPLSPYGVMTLCCLLLLLPTVSSVLSAGDTQRGGLCLLAGDREWQPSPPFLSCTGAGSPQGSGI